MPAWYGPRPDLIPRLRRIHFPGTSIQSSLTITMDIIANGQPYTIDPETPLKEFVKDRGLTIGRVVVERNGEALTPVEARQTILAPGDRLEIVRIVAGG